MTNAVSCTVVIIGLKQAEHIKFQNCTFYSLLYCLKQDLPELEQNWLAVPKYFSDWCDEHIEKYHKNWMVCRKHKT